VSPLVFIVGCVALCAAFIFSMVCAYKFGKYQGWREVVRTFTPHEPASMTLHEGDTLIGVMEMKKGTYFFLGTKTRKGSYSE
jgi:hypothetical protein